MEFWVITGINEKGQKFVYSASNCLTRKDAITRHESDTGDLWAVRRELGDRAEKVKIEFIPQLRKQKAETDFHFNLRVAAAQAKQWPDWKRRAIGEFAPGRPESP